MKLFLQLKHWQLFLLLFAVPVIFKISAMIIAVPMGAIIQIISIVAIFYFVVLFNWFYALGINLNKKLPAGTKQNNKRFTFFLLIAFVCIFFMCILIPGFYESELADGLDPMKLINPVTLLLFLINPIHLIAMFSVFYCIFSIAKLLKSVELQRDVKFRDFAKEFFLMWYFPIGIWFIQPKMNKLFERKN